MGEGQSIKNELERKECETNKEATIKKKSSINADLARRLSYKMRWLHVEIPHPWSAWTKCTFLQTVHE